MNTILGLHGNVSTPAAASLARPTIERSAPTERSAIVGRPSKSMPAAAELSRLALALVAEFDTAGRIEKTEQAVAKLNEVLRDRERDLEFSLDQDTGRMILKVIHTASGEVIRQIPPEELLQIARTFIEGTGSLIEDQA